MKSLFKGLVWKQCDLIHRADVGKETETYPQVTKGTLYCSKRPDQAVAVSVLSFITILAVTVFPSTKSVFVKACPGYHPLKHHDYISKSSSSSTDMKTFTQNSALNYYKLAQVYRIQNTVLNLNWTITCWTITLCAGNWPCTESH